MHASPLDMPWRARASCPTRGDLCSCRGLTMPDSLNAACYGGQRIGAAVVTTSSQTLLHPLTLRSRASSFRFCVHTDGCCSATATSCVLPTSKSYSRSEEHTSE